MPRKTISGNKRKFKGPDEEDQDDEMMLDLLFENHVNTNKRKPRKSHSKTKQTTGEKLTGMRTKNVILSNEIQNVMCCVVRKAKLQPEKKGIEMLSVDLLCMIANLSISPAETAGQPPEALVGVQRRGASQW